MKPKKKTAIPQSDMFKPRLEDIINPNHALVRLASVIDCERLDIELGQHFATVGAAALPIRLMAGLMYLQHLHNLSDEALLDQWLESPYYHTSVVKLSFSTNFHAIQLAWLNGANALAKKVVNGC